MARVKLLNAAGANVTGTWFYVGTAKPVYTLYFSNYTAGNVKIQSAPDAFVGNVPQTTSTPATEFGEIIGATSTETTSFAAVPAPGAGASTVATIRHNISAIRAITDGAVAGGATVWFEMEV